MQPTLAKMPYKSGHTDAVAAAADGQPPRSQSTPLGSHHPASNPARAGSEAGECAHQPGIQCGDAGSATESTPGTISADPRPPVMQVWLSVHL